MTVTVGGVKARPLDAVGARPARSHYVGSHPMAGTEYSGPLTASAALFDGRPWAVTPGPDATPAATRVVEALVRVCGAVTVRLSRVERRPSGRPDVPRAAPDGVAGRRYPRRRAGPSTWRCPAPACAT